MTGSCAATTATTSEHALDAVATAGLLGRAGSAAYGGDAVHAAGSPQITVHGSRTPGMFRLLLEASEPLPAAERPERLTALAVAGSDRLKDRRAAFATFKASTDERPGEEGGFR
ncbi:MULTISPECIES: hypothetical protein [Kitasatospora]|uniref:Uncharacterized protein n=1 Tax=Kitasatospora cathayae TaxID=3004092 RepID=A0ABY7QEM7_9ACTN|nr:hypothetical protein [Kitasatospora sp. HUAS 3-15]WBP91165.1 hypothetical protein O1G21_38335 [Kitasatospora sp. HUAS 3-15]